MTPTDTLEPKALEAALCAAYDDDLIERLQPRWAADEEISRAAARRDTALREIVTDYIVAANAIKSEAIAAIASLRAANATLTAERDEAREALKPFVDTSVQPIEQTAKLIDRGFSGAGLVTAYVTKDQFLSARKALANEEGGNATE